MKPETDMMVEAYLRVYGDFKRVYIDIPEDPAWEGERFSNEEVAILFWAALNTSILGELLKEETMEYFMELKQQEEQAQQEEVGADVQ